jgi:hypothetical protein
VIAVHPYQPRSVVEACGKGYGVIGLGSFCRSGVLAISAKSQRINVLLIDYTVLIAVIFHLRVPRHEEPWLADGYHV